MAAASESQGIDRPKEDHANDWNSSNSIERLLCELDEKIAAMLVMKEVEGFSVEEISESLGINVNTVKVRLFRSRGKLVEVYRRRMKGSTTTKGKRADGNP